MLSPQMLSEASREGRNSKEVEIRNPMPGGQKQSRTDRLGKIIRFQDIRFDVRWPAFRISDFGLLSAFGFRPASSFLLDTTSTFKFL